MNTAQIVALKIEIDPAMSDEDVWNFIEDQGEVTIEDFKRKGSVLYLYPMLTHADSAQIRVIQQNLQARI